jgi:hypothetical protein
MEKWKRGKILKNYHLSPTSLSGRILKLSERDTLSAFQLPAQSNVISIPKQTDKRAICLYCAKLYVRQLEQDADPRRDQVHGGLSAEGGVLGGDR